MKPITPQSLTELVTLSDVQISPDGRRVAFVRTHIDAKANQYVRAIWIKSLDSDAPPYPATAGPKDASPRWSPDGAWLGFVSGRGDKPQVHALPVTKPGEARALTRHKNGAQAFEWSPDSRRIAFVSGMRADERAAEDRGDELPSADVDKERLDPRVLRTTPFRSGTSYMEDRYRHVYVLDVPAEWPAAEAPPARRLTDGDLSFGTPQWAHDGTALFSNASRDPERGELTRYSDVVRIPVGGERAYERWQFDACTSTQPRPSPDGRWIAMLHFREDELTPTHDDGEVIHGPEIYLVPATGPRSDAQDATSRFDRSIGHFAWSKDGARLYMSFLESGDTNLHALDVASGAIIRLTSGRRTIETNDQSSAAFDSTAAGSLVFVASTVEAGCGLYAREPDGAERVLYAPNDAFVREHQVGEIEEVRHSSDGREIQGWIVKPPGFDPAARYPLIVNIHGGPHVMWGPSFESMWHEFMAMAHAGYVVYFCNPRGSDGYGERFERSIRGDWDDGPRRDILLGVDALIARGFIDPQRMCITGGSYGAYAVGMILARDPRFAAACSQRGVYNLLSVRNTSDLPYFFDREMGGVSPWQDPAWLWRMSPIAHVESIRTPLLIEHSELDFRAPIEQAEQFYQALKLLRRTVELVRWPREGHEVSRSGEPKHRIERITRIIEWFNRHAPGPAASGQ